MEFMSKLHILVMLDVIVLPNGGVAGATCARLRGLFYERIPHIAKTAMYAPPAAECC